jgi:hypothetical protein
MDSRAFGAKGKMVRLSLVLPGWMAAATALMLLSSCSNEDDDQAPEHPLSYASQDPGVNVVPTHDLSFQLMAADGPTRLGSFQQLIARSGRQCNFVTSAVLTGGLDGTDEWRVKCADTGTWAVWLKPGEVTDIARCPTANCR